MGNDAQSERDIIFQGLFDLLTRLQEYAARPENRARRLSLAVTNVEQGALWLRDHIENDPATTIALQDKQ